MKSIRISFATSVTTLLLAALSLTATNALAQSPLSRINGKFITWQADGSISRTSAHRWSADWTHVRTLKTSQRIVYYRQHDGYTKVYSYDANGRISFEGSSFQGPPHLYMHRPWSHVQAAPAGVSLGRADIIWYDRNTGHLVGQEMAIIPFFGLFPIDRFSQKIPNPKIDTDEAVGWDIVVPFRYYGTAVVMFYKTMTGQAMFMTYDARSRQLEPWLERRYRPIWDDVAAGNFEGSDRGQELVFHNRDSGETKILDPVRDVTVGVFFEGISHTAKLAVGDFGGGNLDDIMLYQSGVKNRSLGPDQWHTRGGRGIRYVDTAAGGYRRSVSTGWSPSWTHVEPTLIPGKFLLYRNTKRVNVHFVYAGLNDAEARAAFEDAKTQEWMAALNHSFASAGMDFQLDGWTRLDSALLGSYVCGDPRGEINKALNQRLENGDLPENTLLVLSNRSISTSCSSKKANYVALTLPTTGVNKIKQWYFNRDTVSYAGPSAKLLGHEVGHYFGLAHSFLEKKKTKAEVEERLQGTPANHASIHNLDIDRLVSRSKWGQVFDTMPGLAPGVWTNSLEPAGLWRCDDGRGFALAADNGTDGRSDVFLRATPHNLMNYINCDEVAVLTPGQISVARESLFSDGSFDVLSKDWKGGRHHLLE